LQIVTLVQPMVEWLRSQAAATSHPFSGELTFWADCLCAGVFPHCPPKPNRDLTPFESWFYDTIPSLDPDGVLTNWHTD